MVSMLPAAVLSFKLYSPFKKEKSKSKSYIINSQFSHFNIKRKLKASAVMNKHYGKLQTTTV